MDGCIKHPQLAQHISKLHTGLTACIGSSGRVERLLLLAEPPHLDTGEITDKGYISQRKVMERGPPSSTASTPTTRRTS